MYSWRYRTTCARRRTYESAAECAPQRGSVETLYRYRQCREGTHCGGRHLSSELIAAMGWELVRGSAAASCLSALAPREPVTVRCTGGARRYRGGLFIARATD